MILSNYATKTEMISRENKTVTGFWPMGIDYGFSGVKGFSPNKVFCFPNCAVKMESYSPLIDASEKDILLRDDDGLWAIGEKAHALISSANAMNYESEMYGRNRYFSPIFKTLVKVSLGIALMSNQFMKYFGEPIMVQTGLPPKYREQEQDDVDMIKEAISGSYNFELKIGKGNFQRFQFIVKQENVFVMDQPMGALISTVTDNSGRQKKEDFGILRSNTLVFDPGFKTLDIYDIVSSLCNGTNTFDNLGMYEIFRRTIETLHERYAVNLTVSGMQNALHKGYVTTFDRTCMGRKKIYFEEELEESTKVVCQQAIQKLTSIYNYLQNHDNLVITGGTGNAWFSYIEEFFKNMDGLNILSANRYDMTLSNVYSNVRGYYYYLVGMLERRRR